MRLLDRYLLRELLLPLSYCLSGFLVFWISFDLFSELSDFQEKKMPVAAIARYYLVKTPELLVVVMPIALLLALLYALTNHARHNELTAMRAAGLSLGRLVVPYLGVGLAFSLALIALNEIWVPRNAEAAQAMLRGKQPWQVSKEEGSWYSQLNFRNARDGRIWNIGAYNIDTHEMKNPQVAWQLPDGSRRSLIATNASRDNGCWTFYDAQQFTYLAGDFANNPSPTRTNVLAVPEFSETPDQIKSEIKVSHLTSLKAAKEAQLSISEILNYLRLHPDLGSDSYALLHTQLHARLAWPWTCLVVVIVAIPFGAASERRNLFVGVASSIFICFAFFVLLQFGLTLGSVGYIPPWMAAWLPNILFSAGGLWLASRVR